MNSFPWLSTLTAVPGCCGVLLLVTKRRNRKMTRVLAIACSLVILLMTLLLWHSFDVRIAGMQFEEKRSWIPGLNVQYHLGCDGLGILMLVLSAIVTLISILASSAIESSVSLYYSLIFFLEACLFGAFTALNFVHWFTYWELSLIPAFFLIKIWGGPRRSAAATIFIIYTVAGSIAMLLSFIALYLATGTFDFLELARISQQGALLQTLSAGGWPCLLLQRAPMILFVGVFLGFAVKIPIIPFHTWLPAAYSEAPTGATILLTGAMSKMGLYGLLRVLLPIFAPQMQKFLTPLLWLTVATIVFSSYSALAQSDLKRVFAYSSVNHLGYCLLGVFAMARNIASDPSLLIQRYSAMDGTFLQMFNHGLTAATIFWFVALLEARSGGMRGLNDFGGLRKVAPVMTGLMGIALFSSLGLPGLNGFIGEFLIFKGCFPLVTWSASLCVIGLLLTALFILNTIQRVFTGPLNERWDSFADLTLKEQLMFAPAIALMFVIGLYPQLILGSINTTVVDLVHKIHL
ncbi:NADH-quinone oxidoreductase subunit M [Granulicella sp. 5B5]|uniref:complex I subunit 4 family protein n=1 Tax=Granulicella sp. 5B5 TaxID=1617967 RepID=UPI0015F69CC1|nr:NADH-quinone oxidoreductase subunit M [Granulicella sp. 5B5]QMV17290.1 NADH-quinone oxidoreductase subunit M [Granulicella sp. 5B5]